MAVKNLGESKAQPEMKLSLYKDMIGDIKFWDRCIDEIEQLKKTVNNLETQMANAGIDNPNNLLLIKTSFTHFNA